ncbi:uncharacterized protein MELLADRAFT_96110 [Melampsora larici-populina 98AG31]|uniref:Uncharacterized protein n=1 Tax=Melampsora larici-populina (strain 98AG31 / pathotype 3-4-7) TaxID=747676 RepID=F4SB00_MELLP|nr:uncharacterized protein MELLADRAFT_96110 [Melampsora larici-populina 98AG31]EGF98192.1 hypothetical protein MELLADRAFT_96110 [Melampsora larici-populina 98AG31]
MGTNEQHPYEPLPSNSSQSHLYPPPPSSSSHHPSSNSIKFNQLSSNSIGSKPLSQIGFNLHHQSNGSYHHHHHHPSISNQIHLLKNQSFNLSTLSSLAKETKNFRIQGWDPILIITQILLLQSLHYLTLSILIPPLLTIFAKPIPLEYEGGPANVGMIMDWREMVGYGTLHHSSNRLGGWAGYGKLPDSLGRRPLRVGSILPSMKIESGLGQRANGLVDRIERGLGIDWAKSLEDSMSIDLAADPNRAWVLAAAWLMASLVGVWYLYHIVRRPIHIMDHSLTIVLNHLILTTYYSSSFPTSIWFYSILVSSSVLQIIWAENLCVKREMREGLGVGWKIDQRPEDDHQMRLMNDVGSGGVLGLSSVVGHQFNEVVVNVKKVDENSLNDE